MHKVGLKTGEHSTAPGLAKAAGNAPGTQPVLAATDFDCSLSGALGSDKELFDCFSFFIIRFIAECKHNHYKT